MDIYSAKFSQDKKFYVYQYLRKNKSKNGLPGSPYYIGKGSGRRAFNFNHAASVPRDKDQIQIISKNMNEADSFQLEMLLIYLHGRIDLKIGCLQNRTVGGDGAAGRIVTDKSINIWLHSRPL